MTERCPRRPPKLHRFPRRPHGQGQRARAILQHHRYPSPFRCEECGHALQKDFSRRFQAARCRHQIPIDLHVQRKSSFNHSPRGRPQTTKKKKTYADRLLQTIHQYSISIAASFSLYEDIGKLYVKINDDHLVEGITLVRSMGNNDGRTMEMKQADLSKYAKKAAVGIKDKVKEVSAEIDCLAFAW